MAFLKFSKSRCLIFVSFLCCALAEKRGSYDDQPKIFTVDGHLHFQVPKEKSVKLIAQKLIINEMDVLDTINTAHNASKVLKSYQVALSHFNSQIDDLEQRISIVPKNGTYSNTTIMPSNIKIKLTRMNRRLNNLQKRLTAFLTLLTHDECARSPCKNGGSCIDIFNGFMCHCQNGWEGKTCEIDVNECARFAGTDLGCQNGASCVNKPGSYECLCQNGWLGLHCTRKSADCSTGGAELCGHGTCIPQNTPAGYKCICDQGWTTDGTGSHLACTEDVDECKQNHPPCSTNPLVACINVPGSFFCQQCPPGYTGNGYYCADINECELVFNGGCSVNPTVECINTPGSSKCGPCPPGYKGDGKVCSYQGACHVNNGGCHMLARCQDNPNIGESFVQCICPPGYTGNGIGFNGCVVNQSYQPSCTPNPCHHGTCVPQTGSYKCVCPQGFYGVHCENQGNPCDSNPCLHSGTCQNVGSTFRCTCLEGYKGTQCESQDDACGGTIFKANGTLRYPPEDFVSLGSRAFSCAWVINTAKDKVVNIKFKKFHLKDEPCNSEFLQIHDGKSTLSHALGRFCGHQAPLNGTVLSSHPVIYLWLKSDGRSLGKPEFEISWTSQRPVCGGRITVNEGIIQSPGFPGMYPNNRDCYWVFRAPPSKRFYFHFSSLNIGNNKDCEKDFLEFTTLEGILSGKSFLKVCNSTIPSPFHSEPGIVQMHFHTDATNNFPGFQLAYKMVSGIPGCGGTFTTRSGVLKSVDFTSDTPETLECEYEIKLSKLSKIQLTFLDLDISSVSSSYDGCGKFHVSIYKGTDTDHLIGKYCGNELPGSYVVYAQNLLITSVLPKSRNHEWKLKYESLCGDRLTQPAGSFHSLFGMKFGYPQNCVFEIERPPGNIIILDLTLAFLNPINSTVGGFVEVRDGDSENSTLIGIYRGAQKVKVESTANFFYVKFNTYVFERVEANYTSTDLGCGGILKAPVGNIQSPTMPSGEYPANKICRWVLIAPPGQVVQLNWMIFSLEKSHDCVYDNIQVFDNSTNSGEGAEMGKFCGDATPPVLLSSSNIMTVVFTSDTTVHEDGFLASYTFVKESKLCGGHYFTTAGQIKSPGYPDEYPTNKVCEWAINVPSGMQIQLNVTDFNIEEYSNCRYDYVVIRNGGTSASPLIGKYCGTNIPNVIYSHTNRLYVKFVSDMSRSGHGFKITWSSAATGCGGTLTSPTGTIISPHYPEPYGTNADCLWTVSVSAGSKIQVIFTDIDLEKHTVCELDYVELFDGPTRNSKSVGKFCSSPVAPITTSGNMLLVRFRSDVSFQGRGFNLQYHTVCHNTLTGFRGVIESPNFPNDYPQDQSCTWDIVVTERNKINITFSHFALERSTTGTGNTTCQFDYVEIDYMELTNEIDDESEKYTKFNRYCGDQNPGLITIDSHHAKIHFVSDSLLLGAGFRLEWVLFGCGGILTHTEGGFESPNYPKPYPASIVCHWIIKVPLGKSIEVTFKEVDVERDSACNYDYVEIFNGEDASYNSLGKLCHQMKPTIYTSTGNTMFVQFKADYNYQGKGFRANYTTVDTACGGTLSAKEGSIFSPNYPKNYAGNETCEWLIDTDENHVIELTFTDVDLVSPPHATCNQNYIKVFDGPSQAYPTLEKVCGDNKPNKTITSTYNHMFLEFRSHAFFTSKGFMAKYKKSCGARIKTSGTGNIQLTKDYEVDDRNCSWIIEAEDPSKHIYLTISHITMEIYTWCTESERYIYIYNGPYSDSPLLGSYCNKLPPLLTSDGSTMRIDITTNVDFFATYSIYDDECGGSLTSLEGFIASPGYPKTYPVGVQCEWTIDASPGNTITLNFKKFILPESDNCNSDYLEIRKHNSSGTLLGAFCGSNTPKNIDHEGSVWILLKTSVLDSGDIPGGEVKGFYLEFNTNTDNKLSGPRGTIANPLYPRAFRELGSDYSWTIRVAPRQRILLTFKELFVGADMDTFNYCVGTSLKIYDGSTDEDPLLKNICGAELPAPILSSSNVIYIVAQYFTTRLGTIFKIDWEEVSSKHQIAGSNSTSGCSKSYFVNGSVDIQSPGYPTGYAPNLNCEWILTAIPINHLVLTITDINLHKYFYSRSCKVGDRIEVYQRKDSSLDWELVDTVCNQPDYRDVLSVTTTNLMKVVFITDQAQNKTGFQAQVSEECGGSLTDLSGYIIHNTSLFLTDCQWNITVRSGKTIKLTFEQFDLGNIVTTGCEHYLLIRNGQFADSPFLGNGKYCGSEVPTRVPLQTTGNHMYLEYKQTTRLRNKGFRLRYQEVGYECGGDIDLDTFHKSEEISSPNFPNVPPPHTECIWRVRAPPGENIRIDFEDRFDLTRQTYRRGCIVEYVELRDGGTEISPLLSRKCGEDVPDTTFSTDNMMYVKFFTDTDDPRNGFKANISIGFCGGTLRDVGEVQSPTGGLDKKPNCTWYLKATSGHTLTVQFTELDMLNSINCSDSSNRITLTEYNDFYKREAPLGTYCGKKLPGSINSTSNIVIVRYTADTGRSQKFNLKFYSSQEDCKKLLEQESGVITSPGYPQLQLRYCFWQIKVPKGRRITIHIDDIDIRSPVQYTFLSIYNGLRVGPLIAEVGEIQSGATFESTDNSARIVFWSQTSLLIRRGFKISFNSTKPTICVGDFSQTSGVITNPQNFNGPLHCEYTHNNTQKQQTLAMSVTMNTNASSGGFSCRIVSSKIDITLPDHTLIRSLCEATTNPMIVRSPYSVTNFVVRRNTNYYLNFSMTYNVHDCGGRIQGETGFISSPNYPNKPSKGYECAWRLSIDKEQTIKLLVKDMDFEDDCSKHFLNIYNGNSLFSPKIGTFCKDKKPNNIITQSNEAFIEYRYEGTATGGKGFNLTYEPVINDCGGIFHDRTRIIQTPNYGKEDYPANAECEWEIRSTPGNFIRLEFIGRFNIEQSDNCTKDFVEIWDWRDNSWISQGRFCGREVRREINSTSTQMKMLFRSNDKVNGGGFQAKWDRHCGGIFEATKEPQYIMSPGFPGVYRGNLNCVYNITSKNSVYLEFLDFDVEGTTDCHFDNVTVYGTAFSTKYVRKLGVFCGSNRPPPFRIKNFISVVFRTDFFPFDNGKGFRIKYHDDACGGTITSPTGINIHDLGQVYKMSYFDLTCVWTIVAPKNQVVVFNIKKLSIENNVIHYKQCPTYSLQVYNEEEKPNKRILQVCSVIYNRSLNSESNKMIVNLKAHPFNFNGMEAEVYFTYGSSSGCGGTINLTETKTIQPPNNLKDLDCKWTIVAPIDHQIQMNFISINIPGFCGHNLTKNFIFVCECAFVEVHDGGGPFSDIMRRLCSMDNHRSVSFLTVGNRGFIRLFSWGINNDMFKVTLTPIKSKCGNTHLTVTEEHQVLTSPGYPNNYPENTKCIWVLSASENKRIFLNVEVFDLDYPLVSGDIDVWTTCDDYDRLEIVEDPNKAIKYEGLGPESSYVTRRRYLKSYNRQPFCGKHDKPFHYYSADNNLALEFKSFSRLFSNRTRKGFKLTYGIAGCDLNLTADNGRVSNFGLKNDKKHCIITITVPENRTISLYFTQFYSLSSTNCSDSGLIVQEKDLKGPILTNVCGFRIPNPVFSKTNKILLTVRNDSRYTSYDLLYTSTDKGPGCGGYIYCYKGTFTSPLYPNDLKPTYNRDLECTWEIKVPSGHYISLKFSEFEIQGSCAKNKVVVTTYLDGDPTEHVFCAQDQPATLTSDQQITVKYYVSINNAGLGWKAEFEGLKNDTANPFHLD